jgi:hypothetical protein
MDQQYNINSFSSGVNGFGSQFAKIVFSANLPANTNKTITVPGGDAADDPRVRVPRFLAVFSYHAARNVYVKLNATATVPGGVNFAAGSELLPPAKVVKAGDVINVITATADTNVSVALYEIYGA